MSTLSPLGPLCEERDRLLHKGIDFHITVVHCRIFTKAFDAETCYVPQLRKVHQGESPHAVWVLDYRGQQARRGWDTLNMAIAAVLEACWDDFDGSKLTAQERAELRAIPSEVAQWI
jgi:hypothetical protein